MAHGKVGVSKDKMCSYKHTHNGAVHTELNHYICLVIQNRDEIYVTKNNWSFTYRFNNLEL